MKPPPEGWNLERPRRAPRGVGMDVLMWSLLIAGAALAVWIAWRVTERVHG